MIELHNGCWMSEPTVNPKNWQSQSASVKKDWYIQYYFHDPTFKDDPKLKFGKLRIVKGMNEERHVTDRRLVTRAIIDSEIKLLLNKGYNPITKQFYIPVQIDYEIEPTTPFLKALDKSFSRLKLSKQNRYCIKSCLKYVKKASDQLRFDLLEIQQIRRKHIKLILEQCAKNQPKWSAQNFNHYRAYLMMVFKELMELDTIELNPVKDIPKAIIDRKIKATLTDKQRIQVDRWLLEKDPDFRRYIHIFFHSGSRTAELGRIQGKAVDLENQRFIVTVKKGKGGAREEWRPIKNLALGFWKEAMENCGADDYLFSRGFRPYTDPVWSLTETVADRWKELIKWPSAKGGLGIAVDFYSLKHLNLDETAAELDLRAAADMAGHATPVITLRYAQGENARQNERLKNVGNKFA